MKTAPFIFLFTILISAPAEAKSPAFCESPWQTSSSLNDLAADPQWLRLLHFRRNTLYFSSQADGRDFFVAKNGHRDPKEELIATIQGLCSGAPRAVQQRKIKSIPVICQFPARVRWLKSRIPELSFPERECPELAEWRMRTRAQGVKLVFSSYYANNPSSVFGHTLIRLDPYPADKGLNTALLSSGVNFAAEVGPVNPVTYALYGMAGLFPGKFTSIPYYYKVREYNDFDSRDLWEYDLKLTPEEIEQTVDHLWELGFTHFNYYYFTENCSYHLLTALEGAVPRLNASSRVPWWVIPADSVKAIVREPELLGTIDFRPSLYRQYTLRRIRLTEPEIKILREIVQNENLSIIEATPEDRKALLLDAALDYWDYKFAKDLLNNDSKKSSFKQILLSLRAKAPRTPPLEITRPVRPDLSHESMRYGLYSELNDPQNGLFGLELRFSLHDWLDPQDGYPETAKIEFYKFRFDGIQIKNGHYSSSPRLRDFSFFEVFLLSPLDSENFNFSWRAAIGADRRYALGCNDCLAGQADFRGGLTLGIWQDHLLLFSLAGGQLRVSPEIESHGAVIVPTWTIGTRLKLTPRWLMWSEYNKEYLLGLDNKEGWKARSEMRYSPSLTYSFGIGWDGDGWKNENRFLAQLYYFR